MRSGRAALVFLAVLSSALVSRAENEKQSTFLTNVIRIHTEVVKAHYSSAKLFQMELLDVAPITLGRDCTQRLQVNSAFTIDSNLKYIAVSSVFSACDGSLKSLPSVLERTFLTSPCGPRYAAEQANKSCGSPLNAPEPANLHLPLMGLDIRWSSALASLESREVDLSQPYDIWIATAARVAGHLQDFDFTEPQRLAERLQSIDPKSALILFRGRAMHPGENLATIALVQAGTGQILAVNERTPLKMAPPVRPNY